MKRCIICGNVDDDNSTVCSVCGNPFVNMTENVFEEDSGQTEVEENFEESVQPELEEGSEESVQLESEESSEVPMHQELGDSPEQPEQPEQPGDAVSEKSEQGKSNCDQAIHPMPQNRPPRRTRSGPQIYGQSGTMDDSQMYGPQGAIRRTVPPRSAAGMPGDTRRVASRGQENLAAGLTDQMQGIAGCPAGSMPQGSGRATGPIPQGAGRATGPIPQGASRATGPIPQGVSRATGPIPQGAGRPMGQVPQTTGRLISPDFKARRVMEVSRKAIKSPLFLLITLLHTVFLVSSIAAIFMNELNYSQIVRLLNEINLPGQVAGYMSTATSILRQLDSGNMIVANIVLHIPDILFCLGLWLIVVTVRTAKEKMSGIGFAFTRATIVIRMIGACVVMLVVLIISVAIVIAAWVAGQQPMIIMAVVVLVITIIMVMMMIMYYFCYLATLKTCRRNSNNGESYGKLSAYVAVLQIILALTSIVNLLSGIVNSEITGIVGSIAGMGWMILLSIWIFLYRGKMSEIE